LRGEIRGPCISSRNRRGPSAGGACNPCSCNAIRVPQTSA